MNELKSVLLRSWQSHFWTNTATTGVLTLSFSLILGILLFTTNLGRFLAVWGDEIQITVYLKDTVSAEQLGAIKRGFQSERAIEGFQYINKEAAQASFEKSLSSYGPDFLRAIQGDNENPFPASYLIKIAKEKKTPELIAGLAQEFSKWGGVEDVSFGQEWLKNYAVLLKIVRLMAMVFTTIILIGCVFTVSNAVQASLTVRREEIEILELVGATQKTIRRPFIVEGAFQGILAAAVSLFLLAIAYKLIYQSLDSVLGAATTLSTLSFFPFYLVVFVLVLGAAIGAAGSYVCVARLNTGWAAVHEGHS